jgi:hypothetical protein
VKVRSSSSRRWFGGLSAVALCAVLALSLAVGSAAGQGGKCAAGAEAAGCKLPDGARFYKKVSKTGAITVQTSSKGGVSVSLYAAPIKCTKFAPLLGNEQELAVGLSASQHPKVGKTYVLKKSETQAGEEGEEPSSMTLEVTLSFKSAQLVVVTADYLSKTGSEVSCDGGGSWNVKRQS